MEQRACKKEALEQVEESSCRLVNWDNNKWRVLDQRGSDLLSVQSTKFF